MNKKPIVVLGMLIISSVLVNFIFSNNHENTDITLANVEALAAIENDGKPSRNCVVVGGICIGFNAAGEYGPHNGVTIQP